MTESATATTENQPRSFWRLASMVVVVSIICLSALYAHVRIVHFADDYTGILAPLDRVFDISFALLLVGISFCVGRGIGGKLGLAFMNLAEEVSFSVVLGTGALACGLVGLGLAHLLSPLPVALLILLALAIFRGEVRRLGGAVRQGFLAITATRKRRIISALFVCFIAILALRAASPPHNYDEAIYHLSVTRSFVERGGIYPIYDDYPGNMPFLLHMVYSVCLMAKSDIAAKIFSLCLAGVTSLAVYAFCARFLNRHVGAIAMFGFFGTGMVVEVAVTSRIDVSITGVLFLSAYAMMICLESKNLKWLWTSAIFAGFGLGIKYSAAGWLALLLLMFLERSLRSHESLLKIARHVVVYVFIAGVIASPWYIKNLVWFHNPVYPFLTGEAAEVNQGGVRYFNAEDERKLAGHFEETRVAMPDVVAEQDAELAYATSLRKQRHPFRFWEYFTSPDAFNVAEPYHDPNYLFLFSPLFLLFTRNRWMVWLTILSGAFYLFSAASSSSGGITFAGSMGRYLLPIYPGLTITAAYAINEIRVRFRSRSALVAWLPALAIAITVGASALVCVSRMQAMDAFSYLRGAVSRRQFMFSMFYYPPIDYINHNLQPDARVLMIGAQMCYDMKRDYVVDVSHESTGWRRLLVRNASLEGISEDLKQQGITHILYAPSHFVFSAMLAREGQSDQKANAPGNPGYITQLRNWATFEQYRRTYLESVFANERGYHLYAIK